jgi:hypothetical protein
MNNQLKAATWTSNAFETDSCPVLVDQKYFKKEWKDFAPGSSATWPKKFPILPSAQANQVSPHG